MATVEPVHYEGIVWCVRVPTGAFVARRNGKAFVTGNSGFPKGHDASKAIDKHLGAERERVPVVATPGWQRTVGNTRPYMSNPDHTTAGEKAVTPEAQAWDGWKYGTQTQKPAMEPIYLGQKPYDGKPVESILKWGVGAFNIDATRVPISPGCEARRNQESDDNRAAYGKGLAGSMAVEDTTAGRYPANVLLSWPADSYEPRHDLTDDEQAALSAWLDANA